MSIKENPIAFSVELNHQRLNIISDIHRLFSKTAAGFRLEFEQVRWDHFRPDNVSMYEWQSSAILGADANNFKHGALTVGEARWLMKHQNEFNSEIKFDQKEQETIIAISETHDIPEGITKKGDVPFEKKTIQDEREEELVIEKAITDTLGNNEDTRNMAALIRFYLSKEGKETKIGEFFNVVEKFGYIRTGLRAWQKSHEFTDTRSNLSIKLTLLTNNVLITSFPTLIKYSSKYPGIEIFLQIQKDIINQAFTMDPAYMDLYDDKSKIPGYKIGFEKSKSEWNKWKENNAAPEMIK